MEAATFASIRERSARVCPQCHLPDDPRGNAFEEMADLIDSLHLSMTRSEEVLLQAEDFGMEVQQALFDLDGVNSILHRALSNIHTFDVEMVGEATAEGQVLAVQTLQIGEEALVEHRFRNQGLALSTAIIVLLIGLLIMKIREMDARMETTAPSQPTGSED